MKKIIFILIVVLAGCKKHHEDPKPVYKSGALKIEYTGSNSPGQIKSDLGLDFGGNAIYYHVPVGSTNSFVLDTIVASNQKMHFFSQPFDGQGNSLVYGIFTVKVTFNGTELINKSFPNAYQGVFVDVTLPAIE